MTALDRIELLGRENGRSRPRDEDYYTCIPLIANKQYRMSVVEARALILLLSNLFKKVCIEAGFDPRKTQAIRTKFRDAGRRSAPWRPTSSVVPGRPQDGADGNRINRWLLPTDHKFYANEVIATLVEVKYYLQTLSMVNAPDVQIYNLKNLFTPWLLEHEVFSGIYSDPVQLIPINFLEFIETPRSIQSGHIHPLDRGGIHHPDNTFLMLYRSNQIQGNLTVDELLNLMRTIVLKHDSALKNNSELERKIRNR